MFPLAAAAGDIDQFIKLMASNKSPFTRDYAHRTPLHIAACYNHPILVTYMIVQAEKIGMHIHNVKDRYGNTPLDDALREGHQACVNILTKVVEHVTEPDIS